MGTIVKVTKTSNFGRCSGGNRAQRSFDGASAKNEPQMKTPRVTPLEGASTYAPAGAYVSMHCGGHNADERRFIIWTNRI
ncbi:hypothetical protein ig2599ANME_2077 [groundwater metagenome]